jgi:crossover junction endodeoxyribonuclease RusA
MTITLPFPPSANRYWRSCHNRVFVSAEAKAYKAEVARMATGCEPMTGELVLSADFYRPAKRGDLDNRLKVLGDALNGIAWNDDKQIGEIHARQFDDKKNPRVVVTVTERIEFVVKLKVENGAA